jgi:hypothetical protein
VAVAPCASGAEGEVRGAVLVMEEWTDGANSAAADAPPGGDGAESGIRETVR